MIHIFHQPMQVGRPHKMRNRNVVSEGVFIGLGTTIPERKILGVGFGAEGLKFAETSAIQHGCCRKEVQDAKTCSCVLHSTTVVAKP